MFVRLSLAVLSIVFFPREVLAWGTDGHRIVCAVAWEEMRPITRDRIEGLLEVQGRDAFANLCNWADEYRGRGGHQETAPWHYVDVPRGAKNVDLSRDCPEPKSCAVHQIERDIGVLSSAAPNDERVIALKFLIHFVGDVHQPLHVSRWRDEGGSLIKGTFMGRSTNLHSIWDSAIIRNSGLSWRELADQMERSITPSERRSWTRSKPLDWANESLAIANNPATHYVDEPFDLGADFEGSELPVVGHRLSQAGVRLASLLNAALAGKMR